MKTEKSFSKKILAVIFTLVVQAFSPQSDAQFGPPSSKLAEAHLKEGVRKLFSPDRLEAGERNAKEHSRIRSCLDPHLAAFPEYNCSKEEIQRTQRNCALKDFDFQRKVSRILDDSDLLIRSPLEIGNILDLKYKARVAQSANSDLPVHTQTSQVVSPRNLGTQLIFKIGIGKREFGRYPEEYEFVYARNGIPISFKQTIRYTIDGKDYEAKDEINVYKLSCSEGDLEKMESALLRLDGTSPKPRSAAGAR